jgi:hypothetical protein
VEINQTQMSMVKVITSLTKIMGQAFARKNHPRQFSKVQHGLSNVEGSNHED